MELEVPGSRSIHCGMGGLLSHSGCTLTYPEKLMVTFVSFREDTELPVLRTP